MSVPTSVLGMHRSGTSLVARMLNILGVDLGPASALGPIDADNPKGHWEHRPLRLLNDDILHHFGGDWLRPPAWPENWVHDSAVRESHAHDRNAAHRRALRGCGRQLGRHAMPATPATLDVIASQAVAANTALRAQPRLAAYLSAARAQVHTLEQDVHDLSKTLAAQRPMGVHLTRELDDLHDSGAWHLVKASRRALHHVLPEGSRLRHRFTAALRRAMGAPALRK